MQCDAQRVNQKNIKNGTKTLLAKQNMHASVNTEPGRKEQRYQSFREITLPRKVSHAQETMQKSRSARNQSKPTKIQRRTN